MNSPSLKQEKLAFFGRMPPLPIPLDRGRLSRQWLPSKCQQLDIGCGAGYHVKHFARKSAKVFAIDVDPDSLRVAHSRVRSSRVAFLRYDGSRLPFADASFDAVTMLDVLEHVTDRSALVAEVARVLRPGGVWIASVPYRGFLRWLSPENLASDYPRLFAWINRWLHVRFWIRGHQSTGTYHTHFHPDDLEQLADGPFELERSSRRGSLLYALAYCCLCFPPRLFSRATWWASACYSLMALDYQAAYGPLSYNLMLKFRRRHEEFSSDSPHDHPSRIADAWHEEEQGADASTLPICQAKAA